MRRPVLCLAWILTFVAAAASAQEFGETIEVAIADLDVVVVDANGNVVSDLTRDDFELRVDGKPVAITNFAAYFSRTQLPAVPSRAQGASPAPPVVQEPPPVTWIVYADLTYMDRYARQIAMRELQTFLLREVKRDDRMMVACYDGAALRVLQPITPNVQSVVATLQKLGKYAGPVKNFDVAELQIEELVEQILMQQKRTALNAFRDLVTVASSIDGKVAMLLVGAGFRFSQLAAHRSAPLKSEYGALLQRLTEGRITVYSVYAGPERFPDFSGGSEGMPAMDASGQVSGSVEGSSEIAAFADETGGASFVANADLRERLTRARADLDGYYSLGFRPPAAGKSFDVDVRVRRPGVTVRHRDSIRVRTETEAAQDVTMSTLLVDERPSNPWNVVVKSREGEKRRVHVEIHVPLAPVQFVDNKARLTFHFALRDAKGNFHQLDSRELPLDIPAKDFEEARKQTIRYEIDLALPTGKHELAITVADAIGRGRSTVRVPVTRR